MEKHVSLLEMSKHPNIRTSRLVGSALAAAFIAIPRPAAAEVYHPWCAKYFHVTGTPSCTFDLRSQCGQSVANGEGYCVRNFAGDTVGMYVPASHRRHSRYERSPDMTQRERLPLTAEAERPGCTWPYTNMAPPCWSTWPQGDPNYHGSNGK